MSFKFLPFFCATRKHWTAKAFYFEGWSAWTSRDSMIGATSQTCHRASPVNVSHSLARLAPPKDVNLGRGKKKLVAGNKSLILMSCESLWRIMIQECDDEIDADNLRRWCCCCSCSCCGGCCCWRLTKIITMLMTMIAMVEVMVVVPGFSFDNLRFSLDCTDIHVMWFVVVCAFLETAQSFAYAYVK